MSKAKKSEKKLSEKKLSEKKSTEKKNKADKGTLNKINFSKDLQKRIRLEKDPDAVMTTALENYYSEQKHRYENALQKEIDNNIIEIQRRHISDLKSQLTVSNKNYEELMKTYQAYMLQVQPLIEAAQLQKAAQLRLQEETDAEKEKEEAAKQEEETAAEQEEDAAVKQEEETAAEQEEDAAVKQEEETAAEQEEKRAVKQEATEKRDEAASEKAESNQEERIKAKKKRWYAFWK